MTKNLRSRSLLGAGAAAALLTLAACGGIADDAPTDASVEDFCNAYALDESAENAAKKMAEVGTPDGISESQRKGFEVYVDALNDEGDTANTDVSTVKVPEGDKADGQAFVTYVGETCAAAATPDASTDTPTDGAS